MRVFNCGKNDTCRAGRSMMPTRSSGGMRTIAATTMGRRFLRLMATYLDQIVSKLTGGRRNFTGIVTRRSCGHPHHHRR